MVPAQGPSSWLNARAERPWASHQLPLTQGRLLGGGQVPSLGCRQVLWVVGPVGLMGGARRLITPGG